MLVLRYNQPPFDRLVATKTGGFEGGLHIDHTIGMQQRIGDGVTDTIIGAAGIRVAELTLIDCRSWSAAAMIAAVPCIGAIRAVQGGIAMTGLAAGSTG